MKKKYLSLGVLLLALFALNVNADIKCGEGVPGDTVSCTVSNIEANGNTKNITVPEGLTFVGCNDNACTDGSYSITKNNSVTFNFKIGNIDTNKSLNVTIAGQTGSVKVNAETTETTSPNEVTYTVTLVPGKNKSNITKSCTVNSLNETCNVTLDELTDSNFNGWGEEKTCQEGSKGNIKVNKDITYYACYKSSTNEELLLKSLVVKNGKETIDFDFSIRTREYDITVGLDVESLDIEAEADEGIDVTVDGNENLKEGENKITITLTDKDGASSNYILNVTKTEEMEPPKLLSLNIRGYNNFNFNPDTYVYELTIDSKIKSLIIDYEANNDNEEVEITGNENLRDGSKIKVIITDKETDLSSTYEINIHLESSNLIMYIAIGAGLLVILIILLIVVIKKGKKNNTNKSDNNKIKESKGKKAVSNIPEVQSVPVQPVQPVSPVPPQNSNDAPKEEVETLDF